jgi:hypothetical protein
MNLWKHLCDLLAYLSPEPSLSPRAARKHIAAVTVLLAVAAIGGAVVLTPSDRTHIDIWQSLRQSITKRAQVDLFDDFSEGLDAWSGPGLESWSYDDNGFVNPGALSFFAPSMRLTNYDLDALVQIEAKGLNLVFRAVSSHTYQVAKLETEGSNSMPSLAVSRYAMIAGQPSRAVVIRYPERSPADTLYRVHLEIRDDNFSLYIQGNLVDSWTDPRLQWGGVGLFCLPGERARVAWVRTSYHTDSLGRMCSLLSSMF